MRLTCLSLLLCLLLPAARAGTTIWVGSRPGWLAHDPSLPDGLHRPSLEAALAAAHDGDRVILTGGEHGGTLRIKASIQLLGYGRQDPPLLTSSLEVLADDVTIDFLAFGPGTGPLLLARGVARLTVTRCELRHCEVGMELVDCVDARLEDNLLVRAGRSLLLEGGSGPLLRRNVVLEGGQFAVELEGCPDARLLRNIVRRPGWTGILLHSGSGGALLEGNLVDGGDIGLAIQTDGNRLIDNLVIGAGRGVLLGVSPRGTDPDSHLRTAFLDSDHGDARVDARDNLLRGNRFQDCRTEGMVLRGATHNTLTDNQTVGGLHGVVLMAGADDNLLHGNRARDVTRAAVALIDTQGNRIEGPGSVRRIGSIPDRRADQRVEQVPAVGAGQAADGSPAAGVEQPVGAVLPRLPPGVDVPAPGPAPLGGGRLLLWGDLHTHSLLSDGCTSPEEILSYGRDVLGLHFVALSDHAEVLSREDTRWPRLNAVCREQTVPGSFLAIAGYEVTYPVFWDGHYNVYFPHFEGHLHRSPYDEYTTLSPLEVFTPARLLDRLRADDDGALVVRHHYGPARDYWRDAPDDPWLVPLTEICSVHGIFAGDRGLDRNRNHRVWEGMGHTTTVAMGLSAGRVTGIVASSDDHYGFPGDRGLLAVQADAFTPEALFEGLRARRTWGTTGARIQLGLLVNGAPMGAVLARAQGGVHVEAQARGVGDLAELLLLRNGEVLARGELQGNQGRLSFDDPAPPLAGTRYRVRVRQLDGQAAWSSPVWFDPPPPALADAGSRADRERMSLMLYAASLRAWHKLGLGALDGLSPAEAAADPAQRPRLVALWPAWVEAAQKVNAMGEQLGLVSREQAQRIVERWSPYWGNQLPRSTSSVAPIIDIDRMASLLGLPTP